MGTDVPVLATALGLLLAGAIAAVPAPPERPLPHVSVAVNADGVAEGAVARVVVSLDRAAARVVTVGFDTRRATAKGHADFEPVHEEVTVPVGSTRVVVPVRVVADGLDERDEDFTVRLSSPRRAVLGTDRASVAVLDADPPPRVVPEDATMVEPALGHRLGFTEVRLSAPSARRVVVDLVTRSGTAQAGRDFVPLHPTVVFAPGETRQPVSVEMLSDGEVEPPETLRLVVLAVRHARAGRPATVTLLDSSDEPRSAHRHRRPEA